MTDSMSDSGALHSTTEYNIYGRAGCFTVNFASPNNLIHQVSGFRTEGDAQTWVSEALAGRAPLPISVSEAADRTARDTTARHASGPHRSRPPSPGK
jgi:hypothetical protein